MENMALEEIDRLKSNRIAALKGGKRIKEIEKDWLNQNGIKPVEVPILYQTIPG